MRLARIKDVATALVVDDHVLDVGAQLAAFGAVSSDDAELVGACLPQSPSGTWSLLIERWGEVRPALAAMEDWARDKDVLTPLAEVRLRPPIPACDARIFAIGANFAPHAARSERAMHGGESVDVERRVSQLLQNKLAGVPPWGFNVLPGTVVGPGDTIRPPAVSTRLDYEGEVAVVLGPSDTGDVRVWGITAWNDFSVRDPHFKLGPRIDEGPLTWSLQKNFDTGSACGPWVVVDEDLDPNHLELRLKVNGDVRQSGDTADMIYTFADVWGHLGQFLTMRPGDVIASGTPAGTAFEGGVDGPFLGAGDVVELEVAGVGVLRNTIAEPARPETER